MALSVTTMEYSAINTEQVKRDDRGKSVIYKILTATGFIVAVAVQLIVRLLINFDLSKQIDASGADGYLTPAHIGSDGRIYASCYSFKDAYLSLISAVFKLFGNNDELVMFVNIALELLALIILFFAIKRLFGGLCAVILSIGVALYPVYLVYFLPVILLWREIILIYLCGVIVLYIISLIKSGICKHMRKKAFIKEALSVTDVKADEEKDTADDTTIPMEEIKSEDYVISKNPDKVELLINPLPLPKKKERRELDYDIEVNEEDMKYDYEVSEENMHFDVEDAG